MGGLGMPPLAWADDPRAGLEGIGFDATGHAGDPVQDTWVAIGVTVRDGVIEQARYGVFGCPYTMAAVAWVAQTLEGGAVTQLGAIDVAGLRRRLNMPTERLGRLLLIEDAAKACLGAWQRRRG